jgi:hypothetical protein
MIESPVSKQLEPDVQSVVNQIVKNALGNIIMLGSAPTAQDDLKQNTLGYYSGTLYYSLADGSIIEWTVTTTV